MHTPDPMEGGRDPRHESAPENVAEESPEELRDARVAGFAAGKADAAALERWRTMTDAEVQGRELRDVRPPAHETLDLLAAERADRG